MATEVYIPTEVTFAGKPVPETFVVTLYNPDSSDPAGSLTTHNPPAEGARGPFECLATRDGKSWRVTLGEIEISRSTPVGSEFTIFGPVTRTPV